MKSTALTNSRYGAIVLDGAQNSSEAERHTDTVAIFVPGFRPGHLPPMGGVRRNKALRRTNKSACPQQVLSSPHRGRPQKSLPVGRFNASEEGFQMAATQRADSIRSIPPFHFLPYVDAPKDGAPDWWIIPVTGRHDTDRAIGEDMARRLLDLCRQVPGADLGDYAAWTAEAMAAKGARGALLGFVDAIGDAASGRAAR